MHRNEHKDPEGCGVDVQKPDDPRAELAPAQRNDAPTDTARAGPCPPAEEHGRSTMTSLVFSSTFSNASAICLAHAGRKTYLHNEWRISSAAHLPLSELVNEETAARERTRLHPDMRLVLVDECLRGIITGKEIEDIASARGNQNVQKLNEQESEELRLRTDVGGRSKGGDDGRDLSAPSTLIAMDDSSESTYDLLLVKFYVPKSLLVLN
ncbi:hypothetical protein DFH09DRAFT_1273132 [Mycena vulgaris]|nr:hypothetical protein DFH09DRAFT_1273132 [Mycena vulgaris]